MSYNVEASIGRSHKTLILQENKLHEQHHVETDPENHEVKGAF